MVDLEKWIKWKMLKLIIFIIVVGIAGSLMYLIHDACCVATILVVSVAIGAAIIYLYYIFPDD